MKKAPPALSVVGENIKKLFRINIDGQVNYQQALSWFKHISLWSKMGHSALSLRYIFHVMSSRNQVLAKNGNLDQIIRPFI